MSFNEIICRQLIKFNDNSLKNMASKMNTLKYILEMALIGNDLMGQYAKIQRNVLYQKYQMRMDENK